MQVFYFTPIGNFLIIHIVNLYILSKFNTMINTGIVIVNVIGLIKKPNNVKLLNIKSRKLFKLVVISVGSAGIFIQPNAMKSRDFNKFNIIVIIIS